MTKTKCESPRLMFIGSASNPAGGVAEVRMVAIP